RADAFVLVRMDDHPPTPQPLPDHELLISNPSPDPDLEEGTLKGNRISHIVCRNSGGTGAYAKIAAARNLGIPVIMVQQ
ncbi:MAG: precorrin-6A/cobalt-precorrin-6A reductase, partial [Pseudomonadota bacterium]